MSERHIVTQQEFDEGTPVMVVLRRAEGGLLVAMDTSAFDTPAAWGVIIGDLVQHVANAYAQDGLHGPSVQAAVREIVLRELDAPTEKVTSARWAASEA